MERTRRVGRSAVGVGAAAIVAGSSAPAHAHQGWGDPVWIVLPVLCVVFCAVLSYLIFAVLRGRTRKSSGKQGSYWLTWIGAMVGFFLTVLVGQLVFSRVRVASPLVWMWVFYAVLLVDAVLGAVAGYFVRQRPAGQGGARPPG